MTTMTTTATATSTTTLEARLAALEAKVTGVSGGGGSCDDDVPSRLSKLQSQVEKKFSSWSSSSQQLRETWSESQQLLRELDPGIAMTYDPQHQPVLYKRQQVLAASQQLRADLMQLDVLSKLLATGMKQEPTSSATAPKSSSSSSSSSLSTTVRLDQITQAPILTSGNYALATVPETQERLDKLRLNVLQLSQRAADLQSQLQTLMECYHTTLVAASRKCILAEETIRQYQLQNQNSGGRGGSSSSAQAAAGQPSSEEM